MIVRISLIAMMLLASILFPFSSSYAQDSECDEELLADTEAHDVAMYLFAEIEKPAFDRQSFVVAFIVYSNKLNIETDACGLGVQARLLSWAFEVYRAKANHHFELINDEQYAQVQSALFTQRDRLYEMYCEAYPVTCVDGIPMNYNDFLNSIEPASTNSPL